MSEYFYSKQKVVSTFLFANPSFLSGIARLFFVPSKIDFYNESETPQEADWKAIRNDWEMVGQDLREAMKSKSSAI